MSHVSSPPMRALRSGVLALTAVLLAVSAHVLGGGSLPTLGTVAMAAVPLACAAVVVARRRCGALAALAFLGASQWALHHLLAAQTAGCGATVTTGHAHHAAAASCAPAHTHASSLTMFVMHALATVATALVLARGERVLERLWTWLTAQPFDALPALPVRPQVALIRRSLPLPSTSHHRDHVQRRGPPRHRAGDVVIA